MKNLLAWVHPNKAFSSETNVTVKLQIDNSLDLGWKREDIMLATNFDFEYNGVKSIVVRDDNFLQPDNTGSKHMVILELISRGFIGKGELYWFHDLDAFQSETITEAELGMKNEDLSLCDYGWRERWATGSMFFKASAEDIFKILIQTGQLLNLGEEFALMVLTHGLTGENRKRKDLYSPEILAQIPKIKGVKRRIKKINNSYNFFPFFETRHCYEIAIKPIKVVHFHPFAGSQRMRPWPMIPSCLNFFMYGDNEIETVFMSERLIKIFIKHGLT